MNQIANATERQLEALKELLEAYELSTVAFIGTNLDMSQLKWNHTNLDRLQTISLLRIGADMVEREFRGPGTIVPLKKV